MMVGSTVLAAIQFIMSQGLHSFFQCIAGNIMFLLAMFKQMLKMPPFYLQTLGTLFIAGRNLINQMR